MKIHSGAFLKRMLLTASCLILPLSGEVVTLEETGGSSLTAKLVSCDGTNLKVLRVSDKRTFTIPLSRLSEDSKAAVKDWQSKGGGLVETFEVNVTTGKTGKNSATDDFDDKRVNLDPVITVTNPDTQTAARKAKITALFLGRPVADSNALHVLKTSTFDLPSLQPGTSKDFLIGKISVPYDDRGYSKFGSRYLGYVVIIHDDDGANVYTAKSVPSALTSTDPLVYLKLETKKNYDRSFKVVELPKYIDR